MRLWFSTYIFCDFCFWTSVRGDLRNNNCFGVFLGVMNQWNRGIHHRFEYNKPIHVLSFPLNWLESELHQRFEYYKPLHVFPSITQLAGTEIHQKVRIQQASTCTPQKAYKKTCLSTNSHNCHQCRSYLQEAFRLPSFLPMPYSVNNIIHHSTDCSA